ncbi:hypothetical protein BCR32DRAFT_248751 [Anaeromyces robustus]|uniref:Uncharacterized protein n=1 Tax=Anaeromyces robustus TaxID=1754192 RepID=A0A1Y1WSQ0_9FUNG|nr:hypothetical protein BCR32DRAFT_248751 [Anaeromyces robustus]|eukprot:ORX76425.1 hypothetical protein BCR32DRAFT_248751 [Anaeromyces robustus]
MSTITIRKDEKIFDFYVRFNSLFNQIKLNLNDQASYYINAFRNWSKIYEALLEEPSTLQEAMKITSKKGKIFDLLEESKNKNKNSLNVPRKSTNSHNNKNEIKTFKNNQYNNYRNYNNNYKSEFIPSNNNNYNSNNYNNNVNNRYNIQFRENINKGIEQRRNLLRYPKPTTEELNEITKKLKK